MNWATVFDLKDYSYQDLVLSQLSLPMILVGVGLFLVILTQKFKVPWPVLVPPGAENRKQAVRVGYSWFYLGASCLFAIFIFSIKTYDYLYLTKHYSENTYTTLEGSLTNVYQDDSNAQYLHFTLESTDFRYSEYDESRFFKLDYSRFPIQDGMPARIWHVKGNIIKMEVVLAGYS